MSSTIKLSLLKCGTAKLSLFILLLMFNYLLELEMKKRTFLNMNILSLQWTFSSFLTGSKCAAGSQFYRIIGFTWAISSTAQWSKCHWRMIKERITLACKTAHVYLLPGSGGRRRCCLAAGSRAGWTAGSVRPVAESGSGPPTCLALTHLQTLAEREKPLAHGSGLRLRRRTAFIRFSVLTKSVSH